MTESTWKILKMHWKLLEFFLPKEWEPWEDFFRSICCVNHVEHVVCCQSVIDLKNNVLMIGDTTTPFLHESELPEYARLNSVPGDVVPMDEDRQLAEALQRSASDAPPHGTLSTECLQLFSIIHALCYPPVDII